MLLQILASIGLAIARFKAGFIAVITFLGGSIVAVLNWVITHWGKYLAMRITIFVAWVLIVQEAVALLNQFISGLIELTLDFKPILSLLNLTGSWLQGVLFESLKISVLWQTLVDCFSFWLGCHTFRMLYHRFIWAQKFTCTTK